MKGTFVAELLIRLYYNKYYGKYIPDIFSFSQEVKNVSNISLKELNDMDTFRIEIGSLKWSDDKAKKVIQYYIEESNGNDKINEEQIILAEARMMEYELKKGDYCIWNDKIEFKSYFCQNQNESPKVYVNFYTGMYFFSDDKDIGQYIKKIMTEKILSPEELMEYISKK